MIFRNGELPAVFLLRCVSSNVKFDVGVEAFRKGNCEMSSDFLFESGSPTKHHEVATHLWK